MFSIFRKGGSSRAVLEARRALWYITAFDHCPKALNGELQRNGLEKTQPHGTQPSAEGLYTALLIVSNEHFRLFCV
ncbi:hypothetical protein AMEX_G14470 [Astyanax mexicanus]|uniref:Uncharacterized protein n=1 Tax=Astyanax mexicanus TaxID=7994 RepID=A0A8T2LQ65_ASTMX|nr:hypothetical protein AMEX_G14470 [Astyanax mexicanus]